ncbi:2-dehydro-3-deoxygluconokinase [Caloramator mitchellensis]|uniref:2-dehydro-3-deoxygluconokinase n=1 Tax=Caloramator mitchellensis TaxID=908809 RepID=A0A0R3JS96_CALMK|nr:carbohydrate kinase [Caloramator mitchellensis]KRQ86371.1 2-dehydro-3-deoxygluconokinase [Caloramator mitchellensis]
MVGLNERIDLKNKNYDLIAVGEVLIDMISKDYSDGFECDTFIRHFGGSPANIAINTRKLGINSIIASSVGRDALGDFLLERLKKSGVETTLVNRVEKPTSMVFVTKSKSSPRAIFYRGADYLIEYSSDLEKAVKNSKILHFSTWPISMQPSRQTIERLLMVAKENGCIISFDPNFHTDLWEDGEFGREYVKKTIKYADIIKPSEDDAERIFGRDDLDKQIDKFHELGAKLVLMTLGKDGIIVSNGKDKFKLASLATEVVDTTGAGDAFWSGFYAGITSRRSILESVEIGQRVSAFKLKYVGAIAPLECLAELTNNSRTQEIK